MSTIQLNGEPNPWLQSILDEHFTEHHLRSEHIQRIEMHADIIPFPRDLLCNCTRCRSPFQQYSTVGKTVTLTTDTDDLYTAQLPGDPDSLKHVWEKKEEKI